MKSETVFSTGGHYWSFACDELCCLHSYLANEFSRECYRSVFISMYDITVGYIHAEHLHGLPIRDYMEIGMRRP